MDQLCVIDGVKTTRGLKELYETFGTDEFSGPRLREVMVSIVPPSLTRNAAWHAALTLGRLVKSGMVDRVGVDTNAKASWGHTYQISDIGFKQLGVDVEDQGRDVDEDFNRLMGLMRRISNRRVRLSPAFMNDANNRELLRFGLGAGWLQVVVSVTPEGVDRLRDESSGKQ